MYSFGVLLLEVATGLKPAEVVVQQQGAGGLLSNTLISAVQESYAKGELLQMADERLNGDFDERQMERVLLVGLLCVQQLAPPRPSGNKNCRQLTVRSQLSGSSISFPLIFPITAWGWETI